MRVHSGLYEFVDELSEREQLRESGEQLIATAAPVISRRRRRRWWIAIAASLVIGLLAITRLPAKLKPVAESPLPEQEGITPVEPPEESARATARPIALISRMAGVSTTAEGQPLHVGQGLEPSRLQLQSGLLQLDFLNGVSVVLEGASDFELISRNRGALRQGRVRVYAPSPQDGFAIETSQATLIDRGTEFGVQALPGGDVEVHVFDGQVDVLPKDDNRRPHSVATGEAIAVLPDRRLQDIQVRPEAFPSLSSVSERLDEQVSQRHHEWQQQRQAILNDPDLVVYYDFEPEPSNAQRVVDGTAHGRDGIVVGCNRAQGRWPGKKAIEFKRPHDRVRINLPGEFESLSLAVWIRLDGFDRRYNSILLTDDFNDGHVHWQVRNSGAVDMGIKPPEAKRLLCLSDRELGFDDLGRWAQLVSVIDRSRDLVTHYLDGHPVARISLRTGNESHPRAPVDSPFLLRIGRAELGNWSPNEIVDPEAVRNLNGRIDEFFVYGRALGDDEVARLYEIGRP